MSDRGNSEADLSPAKRALLELRLRQREAARRQALDGPRRRQDGPAPLSSAQRRLWLLDQLHPGLAAYNVGRVLRLRGPLDVAALETALAGIVSRHAVLRSELVVVDGEPVQRICSGGSFALEHVDSSSAPDPEAAASPLIAEQLRRPFDLAAGALMRGRLIRLAAEDHILVLVTHHTASDEGSKALLYEELSARYAAARARRAPALGELAIQYGDYAAWERERIAGTPLAADLDWWRERLAGAPAELELPYDLPRPAVSRFLGARHTETLDLETLEGLRGLARGQGATLFMVVLAAFKALLARYSGQEDIVVGAPISIRSRPELSDIIGLFGNTIVLRTAVDDDVTFRELVGRVRETVVGAFAHQEVPFERLVEELASSRDLSRPPLAEALFNFIEQPSEEAPALEGLSVTVLDADPGVTKVDVALVASVRPDGLRLMWEYSTELFEPATIARMTAHLRRLVGAVLENPDVTVGALPLLSADEVAVATGDLEATAAPVPEGCVHSLIAARAASQPDALAVRCGGASLTYRQLDELANGIAHALVDAGIPAGSVVALSLRRSVGLPAAALGVMKAGCTYLPLDPSIPRLRSEDMVADSGAAAVLTDADLAVAAAERPPEDRSPAPGDPAYLIYTSGSTGRPKGVVVEHRNVVNLLASMCREPRIGVEDVFLAVTTPSFDIAALELFGPLIAGGQVVISEDGVAADPDALAALVLDSGATVMQATPSTWRMLVDARWQGAPGLRAWCGGEALPPTLAETLADRVAELWNVYGPTETTIWSTCWRYQPGSGTVSIGHPIANTSCYVLDTHDRPVPIGVVGELCIGGAGVARGYHARPELTAERFVADPFVPGGRMYRTGDRVRRRSDGTLVHLGRSDHQVKLRGMRVELGEIEATLARHPGVREVAVALREDEPGDAGLIAYVTGTAPADELRALAAESLPAAMVPSSFVSLPRMPRTPNGKLDRGALPRPSAPVETGEPPVGELEERIAALWSEVLSTGPVGRGDDFFALGGHSLSATRLVARLNAALEVRLPMRAVFEAPTVAALAAVADAAVQAQSVASSAEVPLPLLVREPRGRRRVGRWALDQPATLAALLDAGTAENGNGGGGGGGGGGDDDVLVFPASFQQRRVWFLDRLDPGEALYTVPLAFAIDGALDASALRRGLDELVVRHELLRTTLAESDGIPLQVVHPPAPFALEEIDAADEAAAIAVLRAPAQRPFDLAAGPLARGGLARVGPERHLFALVLHHAVADGWSLQLLTGELAALVRAEPLPPPGGALQYGDYALWQEHWLRDGVLDSELAWWRAQLAGAPAEIELPTDRPRPAVSTHAGARHVTTLPGELLERLDALAVSGGATLFMVLTAAVNVMLARYTEERDIVLGAPVSGRPQPELERLIGYLANTLVLRTRLDGDPSFETVLERVKETTLGALAHQNVPFDRLVEGLAPDRDLSRNPLFQVLVMLQDDHPPVPDLPGASVELLDLDRGVSRFDLSLSFARRDGGLRVAWEYSSELFDHATVERFAGHLACLLDAVVSGPAAPLTRLPIVPAAELRTLGGLTVGETAAEIPAVPIHELVAAQAAERPDGIAVVSGGRSITYRELDERANQLAHALVDAGAGPGTLVGLRVDRSVDLIVGIHGVLRAGAAYIPLDPDYPRERVEFMLADAQAPLLVTRTDLCDSLDPGDAEVICLDDAALARRPVSPLPSRAGLDDLVYVIYTSGSTGRPKGVMLEHRNLVNLLSSMAEHPGVRPGETMLGLTTPAFDLSVPDLYLPLMCGGTLALATAEEAADPRRLAAVLEETGATVVQATPSTWRMLLDDGWVPERPMRIVVGGEAVPVGLAERLAELMDEAWNFYGPTETCVWSTCWHIERGLGSEVPIGRPIGNTACYIVDGSDNLVPLGVLGELLIGGSGVARGYLHRPELTSERFGSDPFLEGGRIYRTGDLVRLRPDGLLGFGGRRDHQVKVRGFRIELGEIVTALEAHESVRQAAVIVREDEPGDQRLVAYVVSDREVATPALLEHLSRTLPSYMLPNAFVHLSRLPMTPNGKLDRKALKVPDVADRRSLTAPRTPLEEQLVGLWAEALRRDDVGVYDNLFHLGAHSLLVTRVVARIRETMSVEIPLRRIYEAPTVAEQAGDVLGAMLVREQDDDLESLLAELEEAP